MSDREMNRAEIFRQLCAVRAMSLPGQIEPPKSGHESPSDLIRWIRERLDLIERPDFEGAENCTDDQVRDWHIAGLSAIALEIVGALEFMSHKQRERATRSLFELAKESVSALTREVERDNPFLAEAIPLCASFPALFSPHAKIMEHNAAPLKQRGLGAISIAGKKRVPWDNASNRLVLAIYDHCEGVNEKTQWWKGNRMMPDEFIPEIVKRIWSLPRPLSEENWKEWRDVGFDVLSEATGGKDRDHTAFEKGLPLFDLVLAGDDWRDRIAVAWQRLAGAMR